MSKRAKYILDDMTSDIIDKLAAECRRVTENDDKKKLTVETVKRIADLHFNPTMSGCAKDYMDVTVEKFNCSFDVVDVPPVVAVVEK